MSLSVRASLSYPEFNLRADCELPASGVTALFGRSGCGKTTLLRIIAGLERCADARVTFNGKVWQDGRYFVPLEKRRIGMVFQEPSLLAHLGVRGNLLYGYKRTPEALRRMHPDEAIDLLGIADLLDRRIDQLSGGQRQRIALGRALLSSPQLLLLDEPLSALDSQSKREIMPYLERLAAESQVPVVYVSHAAAEIEQLANHVVFIDGGRAEAPVSLQSALADPLSALFTDEGPVTVLIGRLDPGALEGLLTFRAGEVKLRLVGDPPQHAASRLRIRARDVSISLEPPVRTSVLNHLPMLIETVHLPAAGRVIIQGRLTEGQSLLAEISDWSCRQLALSAGMQVHALIKAASLQQ